MGFFTSNLTTAPQKPAQRVGRSGGEWRREGAEWAGGAECGETHMAYMFGARLLKLKKQQKNTFQNINLHTESKNAMLPFLK